MRRFFFVFLAGVLAVGMCSCNKEPVSGKDSSLTVQLSGGEVATKGDATTEEKAVSSLVLYVFDGNGMLDVAHECTSGELAPDAYGVRSVTIPVKTGNKTVFALANAPSAVRTAADACAQLSDLQAVSVSLDDNTVTSFVMTGSGTKTLTSANSSEPVSIILSRPVAKIRLGRLTNSLPGPYGNIVIKHVFLCNVVTNQNLAGTANASTWINKSGTDHPQGSDKYYTIGYSGHVAQNALTFQNLNNHTVNSSSYYDFNKVMYAMPNDVNLGGSLADPNGYNATFTPTATTMMVVATILGQDYYYPVALKTSPGISRNSEYTVNLTLVGLGNTIAEGPFNKIEKANIQASITVSNWTDGATYTESL